MTNFRTSVSTLCFLFLAGPVPAETIAIIGTGDVGGALGPAFAKQGHTIIYGSRDPSRRGVARLVEQSGTDASASSQAEAVAAADVVVLAVPGMLAIDIAKNLGDLADKIIIDPTNPMERSLMTFRHGVETSNAEMIQAIAPDADVVKAFNTLSWETMVDAESSGGPVSIPLAGNSDSAKEFVAELAAGMGLQPIDVGPVENAHWVEGMLILWINNRFSMRDSFDYHLRKN